LIFGAVVIVAGSCVWQVYDFLYGTIPDMYAQEWVAGMVIRYMKTHNARWLHDWDDLQEPFERAVAKVSRPWGFQQLRDRVLVDFTADPAALAMATMPEGAPPFRIIRLLSGKKCHWEMTEPNSMIWRYLKDKAPEPEAREPASLPHEE
jgi:hypothetical protein